jgi:large subunit ribosomal protein L15
MKLSELRPAPGSRRPRKRRGRGPGSGLGVTAGRGQKGQRSRSGYSGKRGFEGGQMPLLRRVPKRGFKNPNRKVYAVLNVQRFEELAGDEFTPDSLLAAGTVSRLRDGLKILGNGEISRPITVTAHKFSTVAREKIEKAGGTALVVGAEAQAQS